ncbi:LacI family DNA-binding transcriptional regulator [Brevibacterium ammoniilyticum]|uniref:LacI family DNA-binding transcriptional regulator n=1 Tax=Brevibacterium ammoniilyticum TaxID=1046555 RepID=A0ABP9U194_9MICO
MQGKRAADSLGLAAVAKRAGLSTATVSNALNRPQIVAPKTRAKVMAAIAELQFVPNRSASALRNGVGRMVGLLVPDILNPFYAAIAKAVGESARRNEYVLALCVSGDDPEVESEHIRVLAEQRAAGAIVVPLAADDTRLNHLRLVGAHPVLVDRHWQVDDGCSVMIDDVEGGRLAVRHLLETTDGNILVVNGSGDIPQCADRSRGARKALEIHGSSSSRLTEIELDEMTIEAGRVAVEAIDLDEVTGIFATNDQLAVGCIRALEAKGKHCPGDVAVVGYGDLALASEAITPLTTVRQPTDVLGRIAFDVLLDEIERPSGHRHQSTLLDPKLVLRDSAP